MLKRMLSLVLCAALLLTIVPTVSLVSVSAAATNLVVMPDNDGVTNNVTYTLGAGTDAEVSVICDWRNTSWEPTASITPRYIAIHCMGNYASGADAKANHSYHNSSSAVESQVAWHYTVGKDVIYQGLADTRKGWHVGTSTTNAPSNSNSIGLELVVNNFPASGSFEGEYWEDGDAIMAWWESQFDQTMKNAAMLTLVLCKRWDLDWETSVKMHWDSKSYVNGTEGKDCPMQMRATYDPATNTFAAAGRKVDGRDGYFWQIFWSYLEAYASGSPDADGTNLTTAEKLGTYKVTPSDGLNVRSGPGSTYDKVSVLECGDIVDVTELSGNWGKILLDDGTEGWCNIIDYGDYIGIDAQAYEIGANSEGMLYSYDSDGSLTLTNASSGQGQFDLYMPRDIGTATTPYMSLKVTPLTGDGYYFGITQKESSYWMMHDSAESAALINKTESTYNTTGETLEINLQEYWLPEDGYRINHVRFYLAPNSSIEIEYLYFADEAGVVCDTRYNLLAASSNITLLQPDTLDIADRTKYGSYEYSNGTLKVTADTDAGFDVTIDLNEQIDVNTMKRFLVGINADTDFNVSILVTHANGEGWVTLATDFYPSFTDAYPESGYLSAWTGTAGLDLYNYYAYNQVLPTDGLSTVKQMKISLGSAGTSYFNSIQIAENDRILTFSDGVYKTDSVSEDPIPPTPGLLGDVNMDGTVSTVDARLIVSHILGTATLTEEQLSVADFDANGEVSTADVRAILMSVIV